MNYSRSGFIYALGFCSSQVFINSSYSKLFAMTMETKAQFERRHTHLASTVIPRVLRLTVPIISKMKLQLSSGYFFTWIRRWKLSCAQDVYLSWFRPGNCLSLSLTSPNPNSTCHFLENFIAKSSHETNYLHERDTRCGPI